MSPIRPRERFLVFGSPAIEDPEIQEVIASMKSGWLGTGPKVARFEEMFKAYKGSNYSVAVSSCTAALHLSMLASGLKPGDEVITTPLTFCATINAIIQYYTTSRHINQSTNQSINPTTTIQQMGSVTAFITVF